MAMFVTLLELFGLFLICFMVLYINHLVLYNEKTFLSIKKGMVKYKAIESEYGGVL
jgi:hypothetical protein